MVMGGEGGEDEADDSQIEFGYSYFRRREEN